jgi:hypothetical protein
MSPDGAENLARGDEVGLNVVLKCRRVERTSLGP